ncbi:MAG: rod-binding protein [Lachnospiraceae bacterium]|nr:rod-binding protein [Lachnospiraceae bacterium]
MAITGTDPSSYYSDYYTNASKVSAAALEKTLGNVNKETKEDELMEACKEFEAYFIEQIFKGMEKTIMKADNGESSTASQYMDYFGDMRTQEYAKMAANQGNGIGLASQLYEQMKRNYGL